MTKKLLFSVTASDCDWKPYIGSGNGGQNKQKTASAMRCTHRDSGAVGECEEYRSQSQNKKEAFKRMAATETFKKWLDMEIKRQSGQMAIIEQEVEQSLRHTKVEVKDENGRWVNEPKT